MSFLEGMRGSTDEEMEAHHRMISSMSERLVPESELEAIKAENTKLIKVLHEVEKEAVYAYHSLQHDCEVMVDDGSHYFEKWWHAECERDRLKTENAKLRELVRDMMRFYFMPSAIGCKQRETELLERARELGVEKDNGELWTEVDK